MFLNRIEKMPWEVECDASVPYRAMTVQLGFSHRENDSDEVEFCIAAWNAKELCELFEVFCKENNFKDVYINNLSIVRVAPTMDELIEMEEMDSGYFIPSDGAHTSLSDKIMAAEKQHNEMKTQNEPVKSKDLDRT